MTNLLVSIIIAIGLVTVTAWSAMELFQGARDGYDQQMVSLRLEQAATAVKSKIRMVDGLPTLPAPVITSNNYPALPSWISANATDTNGHQFVYCPYALRPTSNIEGTSSTTVTGPGYNIVTYSSSLFGTNSPSYVVGSDKPNLYTPTPPTATLTPSAASGYGITFTASSAVFSASNIGQMISSGGAAAIITGYNSPTQVVATITQNFPSTSAIASGSWNITSVTPKGLLGFIIAFKPHDTFNATTAQTWCNNVKINESGGYTTNTNPSGLVAPIIVPQSQYQQAYAKTDRVTYYAAPSTSGDSSGRDQNNATTLQGAMALITALRPAQATIYLASGTHTLLTEPYYNALDPDNLRGMTLTIDGTGNSPTINLKSSYDGSKNPLDIPVSLTLKNLTLDSSQNIHIQNYNTATKWIFDGVTVTGYVRVNMNNTLWLRGTTSFGGNVNFLSPAKVYVNGNVSFSDDCVNDSAAYLGIGQGAEVDVLQGANLTGTDKCGSYTQLVVSSGGILNVSGTLTLTAAIGVQAYPELLISPAAFANFNNATVNFGSSSGSAIKAGNIKSINSAIFDEGEINANNTAFLFPAGALSAYKIAAIDVLYGGKLTLHNGSVIGSSSSAPYYGVYDEGGTFLGGSSTGYSTGGNGEGGSAQSNIYVQNTAGAACWAGTPWPTSTASGSSAQQRHLFWDSMDGTNNYTINGTTYTNNNTSAPRGMNVNVFNTTLTAASPTIPTTATATSPVSEIITVNSTSGMAVGGQISIVSTANASNYMSGYITAINSGTGSVTVNVTAALGSGTIAAGGTVAGGYDARHLVLANQTNWSCHNSNTNTSPTAFTFATPPTWCATPTPYISETIEPNGYNSPATISISGTGSPQYSLDGGNTWTNFTSWPGTGTISPGQTLTLKNTPSTTNSSSVYDTVTIGSMSTTWTINTSSSCSGGGSSNPTTFVQQANDAENQTNTLNPVFNNGTIANDLIVVTVADDEGGLSAVVTDDQGNTYNQIDSTTDPTGTVDTMSFYAVRSVAGTMSITVTLSDSPNDAIAIATEYPITNNSTFDKETLNSGSTTASTSGALAQANELVLGYNALYNSYIPSFGNRSGFANISGGTPSSDFTTVSSSYKLRFGAATNYLVLGQSDTWVSTTAGQTVSYTDTGTNITGNTGIVTFKSP